MPPFCEEMRSTFPPEVPSLCLVLPCQYKYKGILLSQYLSTQGAQRGLLTGEMPVGGNEGSPPLTYLNLLSPFPGFGPVFTTSDPDSFWQQLNEIHALGGGDEPEMCLSALEVCPPHPFSSSPPTPFQAPPSRELELPWDLIPPPHLQNLVPFASLQVPGPYCLLLCPPLLCPFPYSRHFLKNLFGCTRS